MCGICGIWNYSTNAPVDRELLRRMADTMVHRGPDDSGSYFDDTAGVGLGFRRLSIIDLSPAGHQPMANEDGSVWLVFNGEIYNFLDLRPGLEAKGHVFRSRSDSEVILHHYEERGVHCIDDLNGMFGLALWDARQRRLLLARDRRSVGAARARLDRRGRVSGARRRHRSARHSVRRPQAPPWALALL
jgi:asparagine synthase (glutamine-hydrolysing)